MCEHSTVNFLAKTLFACTAKVASLVGDPAMESPRLAAQSPPQGMPALRNGCAFLFLDPVIKLDSAPNRFRFTWTAFHSRGAASTQRQFLEKPDYDRKHTYFGLGTRLARYSFSQDHS